ncbi:calcineurin-like phosphoesterase C-terminal domain-containing protein [Fulvivirga sediminis]|uniref:Calcineurin-like phosphoesterase family protein n=1 Tax=Fulvivirga sediminis TaxID=2803949 RepID=A0A937F7V2_9BACT|nr:calcineurin-like phosphoesterase family protein [Fulvivirga sediminis]MBL3655920.1 calcineurin-like phosphoesterase family protein [Fulvivirga sediminis]
MKNFVILISLIGLINTGLAKPIKGRVYVDKNQDQQWNKDEKLLEGILVSNGKDIVKTNTKGEYKISYIDGNQIFVIKPTQYISPMKDGRPQSFIPENMLNSGSYDFPLYTHNEPEDMTVALLGDTQVKYIDDVHHMSKLVTDELAGKELGYVIPLGDITFDKSNLHAPLSESLGLIGAPVFYVMGNHDQDYNAEKISYRDNTFESFFGPSYYAFEYGSELGIVLNNIYPMESKGYKAKLDDDQFTFIENLLSHVNNHYSYVRIFMHMPLEQMEDKERLIKLFDNYKNVMVATGHTHTQYHKYFDRAQQQPIHELVAGAVCGSWWSGPRDERGVPLAIMNDGTLKGYWLLHTANETYQYKASGRSADYQMSITLPEQNAWDTIFNSFDNKYIYANVFAASEKTKVEISLDGKTWHPMQKFVGMAPLVTKAFTLQQTGRYDSDKIAKMWEPKDKSDHIWRFEIPSSLEPGTYLIKVRAQEPKLGLDAKGQSVLDWN